MCLNLSLRPYRRRPVSSDLRAKQGRAWLVVGWESVLNLRHHMNRELELFHQLLVGKTRLVSELLWLEGLSQ